MVPVTLSRRCRESGGPRAGGTERAPRSSEGQALDVRFRRHVGKRVRVPSVELNHSLICATPQPKFASIVTRPAICSKSAAGVLLWVVVIAIRAVDAGGCAGVVELVGLDQPQAALEVAGRDRPDKRVDHRRDRRRLARRDHAAGKRRGDRLHRDGNVGRALDRRQDELDRTFAALRQDAFDTEPHRPHGSSPCAEGPRVADERQLDDLAGQGLGLAREQCRGGDRRLVAAADPAAGGVVELAFSKRRPRTRPGGFGASPSIIDISLGPTGGPFRNRPSAGSMRCQISNCLIVIIATRGSLGSRFNSTRQRQRLDILALIAIGLVI